MSIIQKKVGNSVLYLTTKYEYPNCNLKDYYNFIANKISKVLIDTKSSLSINFTGEILKCDFNVFFQYEHTIKESQKNLHCMHNNYDALSNMDYIFEYTQTNFEHIKNFGFDTSKIVYVPFMGNDEIELKSSFNRNNSVVTIHNTSARRAKFFKLGIPNIYDVYDYKKIVSQIENYKILLNVHQIDEHKSLEEIRITPLLFTGIIVLTERSPYIETIPHYKHLISCDYNELEKKIDDVCKNYESYWNLLFDGISETFNSMHSDINFKLKKIFNV